ncbi:hypothetical protein H8S95_01695 [Pontibacter sp. KCTC 32443]|uniref:hypothetical protein n=1 Tax=Pontibacter TaxID=323449 RepID=UPI00164CDEBA|nr:MULTISPECIES: hypothetical protein [Pontibacter]MBC5772762.1 hypothetical protein [Pontibacter sp. KCTC 32443]
MKLLDKWWVSLFIYLWAILFVIGFEISRIYNQYVLYIALAAGVLVFVSIVYQLSKKRWLKAVAGIMLSFGITVTGIVVIFLAGAFNSVTKGNTNALDTTYYKAEFEDHTRLPFPTSAKILVKDETAQGFGFENEFDAHCLIRLSKAEYQQLLSSINADPEFSRDNTAPDFSGTVLAGKVKAADFSASYSHDDPGYSWYAVSFHEDGERVALKVSTY